MSAGYPAALVVLLLVLLPVGVAGAVPGTAPASPAPALDRPSAALSSPVNTTMRISLHDNGNAEWTVTARFNLTSANQTASFEELAAQFEANETAHLGLPAFQAASRMVQNETNREMEIRDVTRRTRLPATDTNGTGELILTFTWTNFARAENDTLHIGDVFTVGGDRWLPGLASGQRLVIEPPSNYGVVDAKVAPQNRSLQWVGPVTFGEEELSATFAGEGAPTTNSPTQTGEPEEQGVPPMLWMGLGVLLLGGGVIAVYAVARTRGGSGDERAARAAKPETGEEAAAASPATGPGAPDTDESEVESPAEEDDGIDEELLSDEERIERLLERNGGRMKQATIVTETGWSNAKVSQLLSAMDEAGQIDKLRIGRENLISFPDEDVTDLEE